MYVQKEELLKLAVNIGLFCAASLLKVSLYQMKIIGEEGYIVKKSYLVKFFYDNLLCCYDQSHQQTLKMTKII